MISKKVKNLRNLLMISQTGLAKMIGVSQTTISHLERDILVGSVELRGKLEKLAKSNNICISFK